MREEYDFSNGIRGRHTHRFPEGAEIIVLDDDVAEVFRSRPVNDILRLLIGAANEIMEAAPKDPIVEQEPEAERMTYAVVVDGVVANIFPYSEKVNEALRLLIQIAGESPKAEI